MSRRFRCAILSLGALVVLASALPCPPDEPPPQNQPSAAGMDDEGENLAAWRAPCPCQCEESGSTSLGGGKLGFALISVVTTSELPVPSVAQTAALAEIPPAPFSAVDPIPI